MGIRADGCFGTALKGCGTNDQDLRGSVRGVELWLWDDPGVGTALEGSEGLGGGLGGFGGRFQGLGGVLERSGGVWAQSGEVG